MADSAMDDRALLHLLSDGLYHSGSELGVSLGVSRAAIWKALKRLTDFNLKVDTVKGKGYRVIGGLDLLDSKIIQDHLSCEAQSLTDIELLLTVDSTNHYLTDASRISQKPYAVCLAEMQTAGRGRRGRSWFSPFGKNIYLSIGFDLPGGVEALSGLSLVIGLAAARVLRSQGVDNAMVKWPNDIWVDGKKLAGVLVELQGEATTGWRVVAGIGLNVEMTQAEGAGIDQLWASVSEYASCSRNKMVAMLLENLVQVLAIFKENGFEAFLMEWQQYDCLRGKSIVLSNSGIEGIAKGIDAFGALQVDTGVELLAVNAGDVSVRPNET